MLNADVYSIMTIMNDPVARLISAVETTATPESMSALMEQFTEAKQEFDNYKSHRDSGDSNG